MKDTAIAFGSNSKDAFTILNAVAKSFFSWYSIFSSVDISSIVESEALDRRQRTYINCVFLLTTNLDVMRLLSICEELESAFGRREKGSGRSRTLDLDIIFFD
jgi:2-amino-4-hydroxy-6-hydroxymethyldihydropteridine diphosphokinase